MCSESKESGSSQMQMQVSTEVTKQICLNLPQQRVLYVIPLFLTFKNIYIVAKLMLSSLMVAALLKQYIRSTAMILVFNLPYLINILFQLLLVLLVAASNQMLICLSLISELCANIMLKKASSRCFL